MIIRALCNGCFQPYEIRAEPEDTALLKEVMGDDLMCECPRSCGGRINLFNNENLDQLAKDPRLKKLMTITAKELYRAVKGGGLPDEIPLDWAIVKSLLQTSRIKEAVVIQEGKDIYVHELHLDINMVMHLGIGPRGVKVLKITKETA